MFRYVVTFYYYLMLGGLSTFCICPALSQTNALQKETMLHPGDLSTGYTFEKGEWAYQQAMTPYPSWAWWGITDWMTAELDFEAWLGGVPSLNFRFRLSEQSNWLPAMAFETMFQYLSEERDQFDNLDYLQVNRQGHSWYNHLNLSWRVAPDFLVHLSGGFTYSEQIAFVNLVSEEVQSVKHFNEIHPDISFGLDWRTNDWLTIIVSHSYGSTFLYADNIPRKSQYTVSSRLAPFYKNDGRFLNRFRLEVTFLNTTFPNIGTGFSGPIGFIYWQW